MAFKAVNSQLLRKCDMLTMLLSSIRATDENKHPFFYPRYLYMGGRQDYFSTTMESRVIIGHYLVAMELC